MDHPHVSLLATNTMLPCKTHLRQQPNGVLWILHLCRVFVFCDPFRLIYPSRIKGTDNYFGQCVGLSIHVTKLVVAIQSTSLGKAKTQALDVKTKLWVRQILPQPPAVQTSFWYISRVASRVPRSCTSWAMIHLDLHVYPHKTWVNVPQ